MSIGIVKGRTRIAVMEEVTEGTYVAPAAATDYVQPTEDGMEMSPAKELKERSVLNNSIGKSRSRVGIKSVTASIPVELIGGGVEGSKPDYDLLMKATLGNTRALAARVTSKSSGNGTNTLAIEDADIGSLAVGDIVLVLETGAHVIAPILSKVSTAGSATITLLRSKIGGGNFSNSVQIAKFTTFYPANSGHSPLSVSMYWGDEIRESGSGMRPSAMTLENFTTGEIASLNYQLEGITFNEIDGSAPQVPTFSQALPPLILSACVYQDGTQVDVNEVTLSVENAIGFITSTCSADGRISSRITERKVSGSLNPYKDDASVAQFTRFNNNTEFSLFFFAANPSSTAGEYTLGSVIGFWLPHCIVTEKKGGDLDGVLTNELSFMADRDEDGSADEIFVGYI